MRRVLVLVISVAFGLVPTALAKGPISVSACGASGCREASLPPEQLNHLVIPGLSVRASSDRPPQATPWFDVRFQIPDNRWRVDDRCQTPSPRFAFCYPKRRVVALADGSFAGGRDLPGQRMVWVRLDRQEASVYAQLTRGLEPLRTGDLSGAIPAKNEGGGRATWLFVLGGALLLAGAVVLALGRARAAPRATDGESADIARTSRGVDQ